MTSTKKKQTHTDTQNNNKKKRTHITTIMDLSYPARLMASRVLKSG